MKNLVLEIDKTAQEENNNAKRKTKQHKEESCSAKRKAKQCKEENNVKRKTK
jgi:hypothetical protein